MKKVFGFVGSLVKGSSKRSTKRTIRQARKTVKRKGKSAQCDMC